jgi:phage tail protein X
MDVYTTKSGDTWDGIAYETLGDGMLMNLLIAANQQHAEVFVFPAGIELVVPEVEDTTSEELPEWFQ